MEQENPWTYVRVQRKFKENIENFIRKHPELGYASVRDFLTDAAREKLLELNAHLAAQAARAQEQGVEA